MTNVGERPSFGGEGSSTCLFAGVNNPQCGLHVCTYGSCVSGYTSAFTAVQSIFLLPFILPPVMSQHSKHVAILSSFRPFIIGGPRLSNRIILLHDAKATGQCWSSLDHIRMLFCSPVSSYQRQQQQQNTSKAVNKASFFHL